MPQYRSPGVYVEETSFRARAITGAGTSTAAFVGPTHEGPVGEPVPVSSLAAFERGFGGPQALDFADVAQAPRRLHFMHHAARAYFGNGGQRLVVVRTVGHDGLAPIAGDASTPGSYAAALSALAPLDDVSTVATPGASAYPDYPAIQAVLLAHVDAPQHWRIAVLDTPPALSVAEVRQHRTLIDSSHAALYHPWVVVADPLASAGAPREIAVPPSGFIAGLYARNDAERSVFNAPANLAVAGALHFESDLTQVEQDVLNPLGVNCLRSFPGRGQRVWGARLVSSDPEWKYLCVRRACDFLQASITRGTAWAVLEPNGERLWSNLRQAVTDFLLACWQSGALLGAKPEEAFFVRCDQSTMTPDDQAHGRAVGLVGVALLKPGEFILFRIGQRTADAAP